MYNKPIILLNMSLQIDILNQYTSLQIMNGHYKLNDNL